MATQRLEDKYDSMDEFAMILKNAKYSASTPGADTFVKDVEKKFCDYGGRMFWSDTQDEWLRKLADV